MPTIPEVLLPLISSLDPIYDHLPARNDALPALRDAAVLVLLVPWNPVSPALRPNPSEVAEIVEVPVSELLDPANIHEAMWDLHGTSHQVTFYRFEHVMVWGATARILSDMAARLQRQSPEKMR